MVSATWSGPGSGWTTAANWSGGVVPDATAEFAGASPTSVTIPSSVSIGAIQLDAGAPAYSFSLQGSSGGLDFVGAGVVNNSSNRPNFGGSSGSFTFHNASNAANAVIAMTSISGVSFFDTASAGSASISAGAGIGFNDHSTAANATITANGACLLQFLGQSSAASATITSSGVLDFEDTSSAGNARITYTDAGSTRFTDQSTAGNAIIQGLSPNASLSFTDFSSAGNAQISTLKLGFSGHSTAGDATITYTASIRQSTFTGNSTAGNAALTINGSVQVNFAGTTGPAGDGKITAGSIAGVGIYALGQNELTVGSNNLSTEVSGVVSGTGGSLVHVGTGTLILSGINTYTGATTIASGALLVNGSIASSGLLDVESGAILGGAGTTSAVTVESGGTLSPGASALHTGILHTGNLSLTAGSTFRAELVGTSPGTDYDQVAIHGTVSLAGNLSTSFLTHFIPRKAAPSSSSITTVPIPLPARLAAVPKARRSKSTAPPTCSVMWAATATMSR